MTRISKLTPIDTSSPASRAERLFSAWQLVCNLNDSQFQIRDALGRPPSEQERILAEVIVRARMQDAVATLLNPGTPVDNDRALFFAMDGAFPAPVLRRAYERARIVNGGRHALVGTSTLDITTRWSSETSGASAPDLGDEPSPPTPPHCAICAYRLVPNPAHDGAPFLCCPNMECRMHLERV